MGAGLWALREPAAERGDGPHRVPSDGDAAVPDLVPRRGAGVDQRVHPGLPADDRGWGRGHLLLHQVGRHCDLVYRTVPYCTVPYCTILYRTVPYRTVPYCTVLYRTILYRSVLYHTVPYRTGLLCALLWGETLTGERCCTQAGML